MFQDPWNCRVHRRHPPPAQVSLELHTPAISCMLMWVHELGGTFLILLVQDSSLEVILSHQRRGCYPLVRCQERTPPALLVAAGPESTWPSLGPRSKDQRQGIASASRECHAAEDGPARQGAAQVRSNLARCPFFCQSLFISADLLNCYWN
jgi:hypothetical protein